MEEGRQEKVQGIVVDLPELGNYAGGALLAAAGTQIGLSELRQSIVDGDL